MSRRPAGVRSWMVPAAVLLTLIPCLASADHGTSVTRSAGSSGMTWLLVAGGLLAVGLAAWSFFAPQRPEAPADRAGDAGRLAS